MSEPTTIAKKNLPRWLAALADWGRLIGPRREQGGEVSLGSLHQPAELDLDYVNSLLPPKQFLLPQVEPILRYSCNGTAEVEALLPRERQVLFGIRSCDVTGIGYLDQAFSSFDQPDAYYLTRRENTALISLTCQQPGEECFCVCADCGPFLEQGYDLQLTDLGERYLVEVGSARGQELASSPAELFSPATEEELAERARLGRQAEDHFKTARSYFPAAMRRVSTDLVARDLWEKISDQCLACGGCAFVCPTCSCFNVVDRGGEAEGVRCRLWDSCCYAGMTREASGHNPRPERSDRVKRRFFHKVSFQYAQRMGRHGCVGCGRCLVVCPGLLGMPKVAEGIRRGTWR